MKHTGCGRLADEGLRPFKLPRFALYGCTPALLMPGPSAPNLRSRLAASLTIGARKSFRKEPV